MRGGLIAFTTAAVGAALIVSASAACMKPQEEQVAQGRLSIGKIQGRERPSRKRIHSPLAGSCVS